MAKVGFSDVIIGTQYGDEGKARVVDNKAQHYDIIARFNGGANAGHTIVNQGKKIALNQVPSGVFHPEKLLYVGSGCVVNLVKLQKELTNLKNAGLDVSGRFFISPQAGIIQPHHSALDGIIGKIIGTTRNGIGPAYADRALRMWGDNLLNIRIGDLLDNESAAFERITENLSLMSKIHNLPSELSSEIAAMKEAFAAIRETVCSDTLFLERHVASGKTVLFEGAQAFMLDVNKGSVPFVTSSSTSTAAAYSGGDLPIIYHRHSESLK
jgi:adenylosuccinate synthase